MKNYNHDKTINLRKTTDILKNNENILLGNNNIAIGYMNLNSIPISRKNVNAKFIGKSRKNGNNIFRYYNQMWTEKETIYDLTYDLVCDPGFNNSYINLSMSND